METQTKLTGTVKFFNTTKGFGFITMEDATELFCHVSDIKGKISMGDAVEFDMEETPRGKKATGVCKI